MKSTAWLDCSVLLVSLWWLLLVSGKERARPTSITVTPHDDLVQPPGPARRHRTEHTAPTPQQPSTMQPGQAC